jgi:hypothetical protein
MTFTKLQLLLQNDELHYLSDDNGSSTPETIQQHTDILNQSPTFILYEYTIHDFDETRKTLRKNNIKHSVYTDQYDMDYIMI